jgi:RHS repeat-associated protein
LRCELPCLLRNRTGMIDARGILTAYAFDAANRPFATIEAANVLDGGDTGNSSTSTTLYDDEQDWTDNEWIGYVVRILSGDGAGQERRITGNTTTTLDVDPAWWSTPLESIAYQILHPERRENHVVYDAAGNVTFELRQQAASPQRTFVRVTHTYDKLNRKIATTEAADYEGGADDASTTTLFQKDANWQTNEHAGRVLTVPDLPAEDQQRTIVSNTHDTLTVAEWTAPEAGQYFKISYAERRTSQWLYDAVGNLTGMIEPRNVHWENLGTVTITGDTLTVRLSDEANEYVIADAIRIQQVGTSAVQIMDNGDPGFSADAGFGPFGGQGHQSDVHFAVAGSGENLATWTFNGLAAGQYQVSATWTEHTNRADDARFGILDGTSLITTVTINQEPAPDDFVDSTQYLYDALNRQTVTIDASLNRTTSLYDAVGNVTQVTNARGHATQYLYDALNRQSVTVDALTHRTTTEFDPGGNVLSVLDPHDVATEHDYDALGRLTQTIAASNGLEAERRVTTFAYDANSNLLSETHQKDADPNPTFVTTSYLYDALDRRTVTIDDHGGPLERRTTSMLDEVGNVTAITNARVQTTEFKYDVLNRQTVTIDAASNHTTSILDAANNAVVMVNARNFRTTYLFDALNRQSVMIDANNERVTTLYDLGQNVVEVRDQLGNATLYNYDALGRQVAMVDALGFRTAHYFDAVGNLTQLTDAQTSFNNVTTFQYDELNRRIRITEHVGASTYVGTFAYDAVGNMTSSTDKRGRTRDFEYDARHRLTQQVWLTSGSAVQTFTYNYDGADNLLSAGNTSGTLYRYTMTYDDLNRPTGVLEPFSQQLTFSYDEVGNRTKVEDSQGGLRTNTYDSVNRLVTMQFSATSQELRVDWTYNAVHQMETAQRYTDTAAATLTGSTSYVYDALDRVTNLEHRDSGASLLANYTFTYDDASRLTSEERDSVLRTYGYDTTNQLVRDDAAATITYDGTGNRTTGVTPAAGNRLASDSTWSSYSYDEEGNVTGKSNATDTWVYEYDHRNQLTRADRKDTTTQDLQLRVDYKYDVFGNIVERTLDSDGDTVVDQTQRYALDGWKVLQGPLGDRRELRGNENWDTWADLDDSSSLTIRYEHGDAIDQLFARLAAGGQERWLLQDRLGSVREVTDDGGSLLTSVTYDAWGNHVTSPSADLGRYQFTGRDKDAELDLQRNRARFYDPKSGRWMSHDPLGFDAGDSNLYRYVMNRPLNARDPSGYQPPSGVIRVDTNTLKSRLFALEGFLKSTTMKNQSWMKGFQNIHDVRNTVSAGKQFLKDTGGYYLPADQAEAFTNLRNAIEGYYLDVGRFYAANSPNRLGGRTGIDVVSTDRRDKLSRSFGYIQSFSHLAQAKKDIPDLDERFKSLMALRKDTWGQQDHFGNTYVKDLERFNKADAEAYRLEMTLRFYAEWRGIKQPDTLEMQIAKYDAYRNEVLIKFQAYLVAADMIMVGVQPPRGTAVSARFASAGRSPASRGLLGGSAQREAYVAALRAEGAQNFQLVRGIGQQVTDRSCVPTVLQHRLGASRDMARMFELAETRGGYTLDQARNFLVNNDLVPAARYVESISMQNLAARAGQANGRTTTVLNVRGTSGPHAVGVQGYVALRDVPGGGAFRIHDPLVGEYWISAQALQRRMTSTAAELADTPPIRLGDAVLLD